METLDLSGTAPRSENWLKSLLWPSVNNAADVDYLGIQGFWICLIVAVLNLFVALTGAWLVSVAGALFFFLGGTGVREHSRFAATSVLALFVANLLLRPGVLGILIAAVLLSNLRATWLASGWKPGSEEAAPPPRLAETWADKLSDQLPRWLWPKVKIVYYIFSACMLALVALGLAAHFGFVYSSPIR